MSNVQTISIKDKYQDDWEKAKEQYDNVSGKIMQLIREDLDRIDDEQTEKETYDLIRNSDLTDIQKKVAFKLIKQGVKEKNSQQWLNFTSGIIDRKDHKKKCRRAIVDSDKLPYESMGREGLQDYAFPCECGADITVRVLSNKTNGHCPNCDARIFMLDEDDRKTVNLRD